VLRLPLRSYHHFLVANILQSRGTRLYDDYVEHEEGALQALENYLNSSVYVSAAAPGSCHPSSSGNLSSDPPPNGNSAITLGSSSVEEKFDPTKKSAGSENISTDVEQGVVSTRVRHLLCCLESKSYRSGLRQEIVTNITSDRELFHTLSNGYHRQRGKHRPYWSLRSISSIQFMKVSKSKFFCKHL
jgi:hypothetical protein